MYHIGHLYINFNEVVYFHIDWDGISKLNDRVWFHFKNGTTIDTRCSREEAEKLEYNNK